MAALAVPAPSIIQIGCISVKKAGFFAFFLRFYFLFLLQGKKPFPLRPAAHQPQPVRSPSKRAKTQTPRQARRKRYCFGSLIPTTPFCHNKTGEIPFCNNIFSFSQTIAIKTSLSPPSAGKTSGPPKKEKPIALPRLAFPHGTPDAIRTHGLPLRRTTNSLSYDSLTLHSALFCVNLAQCVFGFSRCFVSFCTVLRYWNTFRAISKKLADGIFELFKKTKLADY